MKINAIAVFCGSKAGANPLFEVHTRELGFLLAAQKIKIIYEEEILVNFGLNLY